MTSGDLPRFRVYALPPIGRREPGNSLPQLIRALAIMGLALGAVMATRSLSPTAPPSLAQLAVERG